MGVDVRECYSFAGTTDGVRKFRDFLYPYSLDSLPDEKIETDEIFGLSTKLAKLIDEKYPVDRENAGKSSVGWCMSVGELKESDGRAYFDAALDNRNRDSSGMFKALLDKYFPGVYMYYRITGDSIMSNTYYLNDFKMRFFDYAPEGKFLLRGGWNEIGVLYDGNYTKEEIVGSYRLFLGNTDINPLNIPIFCGGEALTDGQYQIEILQAENAGIEEPSVEICKKLRGKPKAENHGLRPEWQSAVQRKIDYEKYPELKDTPHLVGTREDGKPYLYRAAISEKDDKTVRIPECIIDFDRNAFDYDVLFDSAYRATKSYGTEDYVLVLTNAQKDSANLDGAKFFFRHIRTDDGEILYEHKENQPEDFSSADDSSEQNGGFPNDIPF